MTDIDVQIIEPIIEVSYEEIVFEIQGAGAQGAPGVNGVGAALEVPFAWGDATPKLLTTVAADKFVYEVEVLITTAFNGSGAALVVGDAGVPDRLLAASEDAPGTAGTYNTHPNHLYGSATAVNLTITPGGGASQGAGIVRLLIQQ